MFDLPENTNNTKIIYYCILFPKHLMAKHKLQSRLLCTKYLFMVVLDQNTCRNAKYCPNKQH